jgi:hypothetical protein
MLTLDGNLGPEQLMAYSEGLSDKAEYYLAVLKKVSEHLM